MRSSWRSRFWNTVATVCFGSMALFVGAVTVDDIGRREWPGVALFAASAVWLGVGAARAPFIGVHARASGIIVRRLYRTKIIPWNEITEISGGAPTSGPSASAGAATVVVVYQSAKMPTPRRLPLSVVGGYGLWPKHPTPAERTLAGLNEHLTHWRATATSPLD